MYFLYAYYKTRLHAAGFFYAFLNLTTPKSCQIYTIKISEFL